MPYSFTQIEKEKTSLLRYVFAFLVLFYFASFEFIYWLSLNLLVLQQDGLHTAYHSHSLNIFEVMITLLIAFAVGALHWVVSTNELVRR